MLGLLFFKTSAHVTKGYILLHEIQEIFFSNQCPYKQWLKITEETKTLQLSGTLKRSRLFFYLFTELINLLVTNKFMGK